jgi:2-hydroxy-6-oxonona-2,4-dienedioate hydrolase
MYAAPIVAVGRAFEVNGMERKNVTVTEAHAPGASVRDVSTCYVEAGRGETVVLLHGGCVGGSGEATWGDMVRALSDRYHVIAPDLLWSGYTDKVGVPVSLPLQAAHFAAFIKTLGVGRINVVGQSVGAYIAARFACDFPERTSHLVMIGSNTLALSMDRTFDVHPSDPEPPVDERERQLRMMRRVYHRPELITDDLVNMRVALASMPGVAEARESFAAYSEKLLGREAGLFEAFELRKRLPQLDVPSILVWGRSDRFAPVSIGRDLAPHLPRTRYIEIDDGGHAVYRDQAQTVGEILHMFFSDRLSLDNLPHGAHAG